MGQSFMKFKFTSGESAERIRNLQSSDEILDSLAELTKKTTNPRIQKELGLKIEITTKSNLENAFVRLLYKQKLNGEYEDRNLDLQQFYEFYEKFQHFCLVLGSQKIDLKQSKEMIMSRVSGVSKSTMVEESKTEIKKPESVRKYPELGPFKRHTDIPETTSVYVRKPDFNQPQPQPKPQQQPVMISKKREPEIGKGDGEEVVYCVLCFANPVEMLLPCYHGYCEQCTLDWYKVKGKNQCPMCRAEITESDFESKIFLVMSKAQEQEVNEEIKNELITYINSLCRNIKL